MRKLFTAFFFLCGIPILLYGQPTGGGAQNVYEASMPNIIHPSPQAMTFMRYGEIPVSLSSGVPEISIPIHSFKANGIEFPISISYHASGIKVNDISGTVGLGWVLNAGGMIAQTVYGWNDNSHHNAYHDLSKLPFKSAAGAYSRINEERDSLALTGFNVRRWWYGCFNDLWKLIITTDETGNTISDRYNFNFCGQTGVFRYDLGTKSYKTIPYSPLQIKKEDENKWNSDFIITDENGIIWTFEMKTSNRILNDVVLDPSPQEYYLTSVKFPGTNDSIRLTYASGTPYMMENYSESVFNGLEPKYQKIGDANAYALKDLLLHINKRTYSSSTTLNYPVLLTSVTWRNESISFSYDTQSGDLMKYRLTGLTIKSDGNTIKNVQLHQSSGDRMYLNSIQINEEKYSFEYDPGLPPREEANKSRSDFWGYYNGSNSDKRVPFEWCVVSIGNGNGTYHLAPKRTYLNFKESSSSHVGAGMLRKITYPTKGYTIFEYESNKGVGIYKKLRQSNTLSDKTCNITGGGTDGNGGNDNGGIGGDGPIVIGGDDEMLPELQSAFGYTPDAITPDTLILDTIPLLPQQQPFGGVRIKKISNYDGLGGVSWKEYEYEGGPTVELTLEHFVQRKLFRYMFADGIGLYANLPDKLLHAEQLQELGNVGTDIPLTEFGGQHAFYHKVTEYTGKGEVSEGKVEYFYTRKVFQEAASTNPRRDNDQGSIQPLLVNKKEYSYDSESYSLKRETKSHYNKVNKGRFIMGVHVSHDYVFSPNLFHLADLPSSEGLHSDYYGNGSSGGFFFKDMYAVRDYMRLDNTETIEYYDNQDTFSTKISYYYNYDSRLLTPNVTITENSTGKRYIESITYPFDYKTISPYSDMVAKNIFSPVVSRTAKMDYLAPAGPMGAPPVTQDTLPLNMFDGQQIATIRYHYGEKHGGLYVIDSVAAAKGDTLLETRIRYHNYDKYGNPLYISKDDNTKIVYLWSYKGKYPVAEIKNATYQQVEFILTKNFITALLDATSPSISTMNTIEALRNAPLLSASQVTTFYYKAGVGVREIIDPNGMKITYNYDYLGRLQVIKDDDGNILEQYEYHYAQ